MDKTINKNRGIYLLASIGGHFYILITIPLLTISLSANEFGFYTILNQTVVIFQAAILAFFSNGLLKFWVDCEEQERKPFMGTLLITYILLITVISVFLYIFRERYFSVLFPNVTISLEPTVFYMILWFVGISIRSFLLTFIKILEKPRLVLFHIAVYGCLLVAFLYWKINISNGGLDQAIQSFFLAEFIALSILVIPIKTYVRVAWKYE